MGLLEQVAGQRDVGLLGVPRATARAAEPRHHADEIEQALAALGARDGALRDVVEQVAGVRRAVGHGVGVPPPAPSDGAAVALGSVLFAATTVSVSASHRPYFGFTSTPWVST